MPHIALVAMNAYPAINPQASRNVGGLETFAWTFAKALAQHPDVKVSLLLRHTRPIPETTVSNVQLEVSVERWRAMHMHVTQHLKRQAGFPWLKLHRWSPHLLWEVPVLTIARVCSRREPHADRLTRLLANTRADVVVTLGVNADSMAAVTAAERLGIPSILWLRSNGDIDRRFFTEPDYINPYTVSSAQCRFQVQAATEILCQTAWQQRELKELTGRDAGLIRNPIDLTQFPIGPSDPLSRRSVLWIGRQDRLHKRPLLAVAAARQCPDIPFLMVCNPSDPQVAAEVQAARSENLQIVDYVPRHDIARHYREARLFLSTGSADHEGFPNVFLEAAASGTPIVSLEDFDDFLSTSRAGLCAGGDPSLLPQFLQRLWHDPVAWQASSSAGAQYVREHHTPERAVSLFEQFLTRRNTNSLQP